MKNGMRYENVSVNIWTDADFNDCENPDALLLYCYFIANPYGHGLTGIGKMPAERTVRFETRLSAERYAAALAVLTEKHKIVMDGEWVWVVGKAKHSVHGPKQAVGAVNLLASYPASLRDAFLAKYSQLLKRHKVTQAELDRVCIGYPVSAGLASDTGADTGAGADSGTDGKETPPPTEPAGGESAPESVKLNPWKLWVDVWRELWPGSSDPVPSGADTKAAKELARFVKDWAELASLYRAFLQDDDAFLKKQGHALRLLSGRVNAYRNEYAKLGKGKVDYSKGF
jgi:hypothetical protein